MIGLTGQTGAGKTTVCKILKENDFHIIDADKVARDVVEVGSQCVMDIALEFGCQYLNENGTLNRSKLGDSIFGNKKKLKTLNGIMFPYIIDAIKQQIYEGIDQGQKFIIVDAPTLFESGLDRFCDIVVSVISSEATRKQRIVLRDNITNEQAENRIASQQKDDFYVDRSWKVIENNSNEQDLKDQINNLVVGIHTYNKQQQY